MTCYWYAHPLLHYTIWQSTT